MKNLLIRVGLHLLPGVYPVHHPTYNRYHIMGEAKAQSMKSTDGGYVRAWWPGMAIVL